MKFRATRNGSIPLHHEVNAQGERTGRFRVHNIHEGDEFDWIAKPEDIPALWCMPLDEEAKRQYAVMHKANPKKYRRKEWVDLSLLEPPKRGPGRPRKSKAEKDAEPEAAEATPE